MAGGSGVEDAYAVVGTDTGVGKTLVTAGLVGRLRDDGVEARAVKPVQTGYPPDDDAAIVCEVVGEADAATCLARLEPPLAPAVAADRTGTAIDYAALRSDCRRALADAEVGVLEGVGGLRVPLATTWGSAKPTETARGGTAGAVRRPEVLDLVADLELPTVVVARAGLGTLNHTALTVDALEDRGAPVAYVALNRHEDGDVAERTNPEVLAGMIGPPVHTLPVVDPADPVEPVARNLPSVLGALQ